MILVAIVGTLFAALAVCDVWVRSHDADELRDMGILLDREAIDRDLIAAPPPQPRTQRRRIVRTTPVSHAHPRPGRVHPI